MRNGPSASTPISNARAQSDDCHDTTQAVAPKIASRRPSLLSGRRRLQYRAASSDAVTRKPK